MNRFCVKISSNENKISQGICNGSIQIGDFQEKFEIDISFWSAIDYVNHWNRSILMIINGYEKSCLITSLSTPESSNYIFWWPMYRISDKVFIQNGILLLDQISEPFDIMNPYNYVPEREIISEDGQPISEWETDVDALKEYLKQAQTI
jgi:CdiI N-terminal domain